jgi:predicted RNase H-like HicB family nuclease
MKSYFFRVEIDHDPELDVWSARIPVLPGCALDEESPEAALEAIQDAAEMFVELMLGRGEEIPIESIPSGTSQAVVAVNAGLESLVT